MFHIDGHPLLAAMAFEIRSDLKSLAALRAAHGAAGFDGKHLRSVFCQRAAERRADDTGGKTHGAYTVKRQSAGRARWRTTEELRQPVRRRWEFSGNGLVLFA